VSSTPDGSSIVVRQQLVTGEDDAKDRRHGLRGYQSKSFGARLDGHILDVTLQQQDDFTMFTLQSAQNIFLITLNCDSEELQIRRLSIRKESSELQLRSINVTLRRQDSPGSVKKNTCLLKCFEDMWNRFPITTPIKRDNLAEEFRRPRQINLVTDVDLSDRSTAFSKYWRRMAQVRVEFHFHSRCRAKR
jgi:hypothetical protein